MEISFWNSRRLRQIARGDQRIQMRPTDCDFGNSLIIHCYSLLFVAAKNRNFW